MNPVEVTCGETPLVLALPHTGTAVPERIRARLTSTGARLSDTDWHVERLYAGLSPGASTVRATFHRYVVDANRDPCGASLYPGQNTTALVPLTDFDGQPLWITPPTSREIEERRDACHAPYHAALAQELERVRERHGVALLFDCHSIRSVVPYLFEGTLPDLNVGTDGGRSCAAVIERCLIEACEAAEGYTSVLNGRFRGGWTTRHHGAPDRGVHAVQLELAQSSYLRREVAPFDYDPVKAERLRAVLRGALASLVATLERLDPSTPPRENPMP